MLVETLTTESKQNSTTLPPEYQKGKTTIGEYEYRVPSTPTPQKFCPFLSITGPRRLCDWRECGASHLCRGG